MPILKPLPKRLLLGPGPSNAPPAVLEAMSRPLLGHLDPEFIDLLERVKEGLRNVFGTTNAMTLPISATGSAGMETALVNLLEPGERVVIGVNGVFGGRMAEVASRAGADVTRVEATWGKTLDPSEMAEAIARVRPKVVAFVHAETSTGVCQPVEEIATAAQQADAMVVLDCVTSLAGQPVELDAWGIDAAYSGTQKCLSCPPGLSPTSFSARAIDAVQARETPVQSWFLDLSLLAGYYAGEKRVYHHTAPITATYGLAAGLDLVLEEGLPTRFARHREAAARLVDGLAPMGFVPLVDAADRLPMLTSVELPERIRSLGEGSVRARLLQTFGIEVGAGLGPLAGEIWRIGLMGENARPETVDRLLEALHEILD
ncbi:MAG: aminotransferase class V-fold PLP-dependent enzyme [bacterium]|nr:alanine--glyoxylate aminotransferase [Deltaproteobacteria bacterium]MCP4906380.1 aminotransferase class V-fold PLP-dependent enzyme [bacterium]